MLKKKIPQITFRVEIEGKPYDVTYSTSEIREIWENRTKEQNSFVLRVPFNGKTHEFTYNMSYIMKLVRTVELAGGIIPKNLQEYLIDMTQILSEKVVVAEKGREEEIEKIWSCLSKMKGSNAILVGDIDVGKTTIAHEIARQVATCECPEEFTKSHVIEINTSLLLNIESDFWYKRMVELITEFIEANKENTIIYIDNLLHMKFDEKLIFLLHTILKKYGIKLLASINTKDFEKYFLEDDNISKHLNKIDIVEPEKEELFDMIEARVKLLQRKYRVKISKKMINFAISTAKLLDTSSSEPGRVLNVLERAFSEAKRKGKDVVDKECIISCYNTHSKIYNNTSYNEKSITSYHELGHYITYKECNNLEDIKMDFVSILPMYDFLGINSWHNILGKKLTFDREYFEELIIVYLGGRVAEAKITNKFSSGASSDLQCANDVARKMIMIDGLSRNADSQNSSYIANYYYMDDFLLTEKIKESINDEMRETLQECYKKAEQIIENKLEMLEEMAVQLVEKEIMLDEELEAIMKKYEK